MTATYALRTFATWSLDVATVRLFVMTITPVPKASVIVNLAAITPLYRVMMAIPAPLILATCLQVVHTP